VRKYLSQKKALYLSGKSKSLKFEIDSFFLNNIPASLRETYKFIARKSKAQCRQDLIALVLTNFKTNGYFLEIGATDGILLSNTLTLENFFQWSGTLVEPNTRFLKKLYRNREKNFIIPNVILDKDDVDVEFYELRFGELSSVFKEYPDGWADFRKNGKSELRKTMSFSKLVNQVITSDKIDFVSIDTEGSELEILETLEKVKKQIDIIVVEHSGIRKKRESIFEIMKHNNFDLLQFPFEYWDDWYVSASLSKGQSLMDFSTFKKGL